tara:strand:- start:60 stop:338 length:279 start_codon:yes stop_codon:yes gene_type:complete
MARRIVLPDVMWLRAAQAQCRLVEEYSWRFLVAEQVPDQAGWVWVSPVLELERVWVELARPGLAWLWQVGALLSRIWPFRLRLGAQVLVMRW